MASGLSTRVLLNNSARRTAPHPPHPHPTPQVIGPKFSLVPLAQVNLGQKIGAFGASNKSGFSEGKPPPPPGSPCLKQNSAEHRWQSGVVSVCGFVYFPTGPSKRCRMVSKGSDPPVARGLPAAKASPSGLCFVGKRLLKETPPSHPRGRVAGQKKKVFVPKIGLKSPAPFDKFHFLPEENLSDGGGVGGGWGWPGPQTTAPPPPSSSRVIQQWPVCGPSSTVQYHRRPGLLSLLPLVPRQLPSDCLTGRLPVVTGPALMDGMGACIVVGGAV